MQTPTFRFVALPLGAALALTALSMQPAASRASRDSMTIREQVVDCSTLQASEVCIIEYRGSLD